jgi:beta-N-acetylhexosaminidase
MKYIKRIIYLILITSVILPIQVGRAAPVFQSTTARENAQALLERLNPEEKVGQLFLVTFNGPDAGSNTPIYDLIVNRHIGGVILLAANDNFYSIDQTFAVGQALTRQLQADEYTASQQLQTSPVTNTTFTPSYVPLFIGTSQEGDGYPYDQILNGLTPLPSQMAIGATWQPDTAKQVGAVLGNELYALGINLLLGPSLDVLETPNTEGGDLGIRTFGGDPYWVGEMGRAYIAGVHQASSGKIVVAAKHFPGYGGSDRLPEEEVATVRKSLEQLKQIELAPFFSVTGNAPTPETTADALLISPIRYQGFQGNIRATTKPVNFDPQAFSQLMSLPQFLSWRDNGGVMISDDLGSRAVRRFYDPTGQTFNSRFVALDAFLAGSDLLYLGNFTASSDPDSYTSILSTLDFFTQKYRQDTAFAQRVDASVLRILALKYHIYNTFNISQVLAPQDRSDSVGHSSQVSFDIARQAATLISPSQAEINDTLPTPPGRNDRIVFINDSRTFQQCSKCKQQYVLDPNALLQAVVRLYSNSGQVLIANLVSYTFDDLQKMLDAGTGQTQIEHDLRQARWIVFSMLDLNPIIPSSIALRSFLTQRLDLIQQKRLIVFAFNAPYYLGATDVSKLTAYYGLYSRSPQFVEVAARLLFQELRATAASPVSLPGISYEINNVTFPDPNQIIPLSFDLPLQEPAATTPTPGTTPIPPVFHLGDTIPLRTGIILDHNGHIVPDNTPVRFIMSRPGDNPILQQIEVQTDQGIAQASLRVDSSGKLQIRVESGDAKKSDILQIDIPPENVTVTAPPPTITPTTTPTITPTPSATFTPVPTPQPILPPPPIHTNFRDWLIALLVAVTIGLSNFGLARFIGQIRWGIRGAFLALIGGLLAYTYLAIGLPGSTSLIKSSGLWGVFGVALLGSVLGGGSTWLWREFKKVKKSS